MYDLIVIGGGPGGYAAAIRSAQLGGKVALVEADEIGGTCVNRGCIPAKVWRHSAYLFHKIRSAKDFGIELELNGLNIQTVVDRKNGVSSDIRKGMESLLGNYGVKVVKGHAVIKNSRDVDVDGKTLETGKIIISSGSCLDIPDIPGLQEVILTTDQFLDMVQIPDKVLVWEGLPMAVEIASILNILGSKVYLATDKSRILSDEDKETSQRITKALKEQGVYLLIRYSLDSIQKTKNGYKAFLSGSDEQIVEVNRVMISRRKPNTNNLGLKQAGVTLNKNGSIAVNDKLETSVNGIYAIGDATGGWMLSHAASSMAVTAAENAMGRKKSFPFHSIPRGIWTIPQVGAVGLSEEEAEKKGIEIDVGDFPFTVNGYAMATDEMMGAVKIISDSRYGEILGVHIVGENATELIGEAVLAMQLECTVKELANSIRVHPTFSESIVDAGREALNWALYLPKS